jgi:hypothetical protein
VLAEVKPLYLSDWLAVGEYLKLEYYAWVRIIVHADHCMEASPASTQVVFRVHCIARRAAQCVQAMRIYRRIHFLRPSVIYTSGAADRLEVC